MITKALFALAILLVFLGLIALAIGQDFGYPKWLGFALMVPAVLWVLALFLKSKIRKEPPIHITE